MPVDARIWAVGSGCTAATYPAQFVKGRDVALAFDSAECTLAVRVQVATQAMDAGARLFRRKVSSIRDAISVASTPRSQPTPTARTLG